MRLGQYTLNSKIADSPSGDGKIWQATDRRTNETVCIKTARLGKHQHLDLELKTLRALSHPNIQTLLDSGVEEDTVYLVTPLANHSLRDLLNRQKLSVTHAIEIAKQISQGVEFAHHNNKVHLDLKPSNILCRENTYRICDFSNPQQTQDYLNSLAISQSNKRILITADYCAPELKYKNNGTFASDVYSLGVITYELLTGKVPRLKYPNASDLVGSPKHLDHLIDWALNENAHNRPSAQMFRLELEQNDAPRFTPPQHKIRKPKLLINIALASVIACGLAYTGNLLYQKLTATTIDLSHKNYWFAITNGNTLEFPINLDKQFGQTKQYQIEPRAAQLLSETIKLAEKTDFHQTGTQMFYTPDQVKQIITAITHDGKIQTSELKQLRERILLSGQGLATFETYLNTQK